MAEFVGLDYRSSDIGEGYDLLDNVSLVDKDVARRRPGYSQLATTSFLTAVPFQGFIFTQGTDGNFRSVSPSNGALGTAWGSGLFTTKGMFVKHNGRAYWCGGSAIDPVVFNNTTSTYRSFGIIAPVTDMGDGAVTPAVGKITAGSHLFRYRYKNSTTGYISNPSVGISLSLTALDRVVFSTGVDYAASVDAQVDQIILEMTPANASTYYQAATVANAAATITVDLSDVALTAQTPVSLYGDDGHGLMPRVDFLVEHRNRLFAIQLATNLLGWTRPGYPESWDLLTYSRKLSRIESNDPVTGVVSFSGDLYVFTRYSMQRFTYPDDPATGALISVPTEEGLWNQDCLVAVGSAVYGLGPAGAWRITAILPQHVSENVDSWLDENLVAASAAATAFGWYNTRDRCITWVIPTTDGLLRAVSYYVFRDKWTTRTYDNRITGAVSAYGESYLSDPTSGRIWAESTNVRGDGTNGVTANMYAAGTGSTTTNIVTSTSISFDYTGTYLRVNGEARRITAMSGFGITVSPGFSVAPAVGTRLVVGFAPVTFETGWLPTPKTRASPVYMQIEMEPGTAGQRMEGRIYRDFSAGAQQWTADGSDTPPAGITYANNDTVLVLDSAGGNGLGYLSLPLPSEWARAWKFRLTVTEPSASELGILSIGFIGRSEAKKTPAVGE